MDLVSSKYGVLGGATSGAGNTVNVTLTKGTGSASKFVSYVLEPEKIATNSLFDLDTISLPGNPYSQNSARMLIFTPEKNISVTAMGRYVLDYVLAGETPPNNTTLSSTLGMYFNHEMAIFELSIPGFSTLPFKYLPATPQEFLTAIGHDYEWPVHSDFPVPPNTMTKIASVMLRGLVDDNPSPIEGGDPEKNGLGGFAYEKITPVALQAGKIYVIAVSECPGNSPNGFNRTVAGFTGATQYASDALTITHWLNGGGPSLSDGNNTFLLPTIERLVSRAAYPTVAGATLATGGLNFWFEEGDVIPRTDQDDVNDEYDELVMPSGTFTGNITFPSAKYDTSIVWSSSPSGYVSSTGVVTRPANEVGDVVVTLTATISKGTATPKAKSGTVTIKALDPEVVLTWGEYEDYVAYVEGLDLVELYTEESIAIFTPLYEAARDSVEKGVTDNQTDIDNAVAGMKAAFSNLVPNPEYVADWTDYDILVAEWDGKVFGANEYSLASIKLFEEAYEAAKLDRDDPTITNPQILAAIDNIYAAIALLQEFMFGDVNGDGKIEIADLLLLARWLAGHNVSIDAREFEICGEWGAADVNASGYIDIRDLVLLARHLAGHNVRLGSIPR